MICRCVVVRCADEAILPCAKLEEQLRSACSQTTPAMLLVLVHQQCMQSKEAGSVPGWSWLP